MTEVQPQGTELAVMGEPMDAASQAELAAAMRRLRDGGGLIMRMADVVGGVLGRTFRLGTRTLQAVPGGQSATSRVVEAALKRAFSIAILRLDAAAEQTRSKRLAAPLVVLSGAVGGFLGLGGFVPDAAVTTLTIMREIARIAQEEGEDLDDPDTREACLQVFALNAGEREAEMGYFSTRLILQGRPLGHAARGGRVPLRGEPIAKICLAGRAGHWRGRRRDVERCLSRALPGSREGPLHRPAAGTHVRARHRQGGGSLASRSPAVVPTGTVRSAPGALAGSTVTAFLGQTPRHFRLDHPNRTAAMRLPEFGFQRTRQGLVALGAEPTIQLLAALSADEDDLRPGSRLARNWLGHGPLSCLTALRLPAALAAPKEWSREGKMHLYVAWPLLPPPVGLRHRDAGGDWRHPGGGQQR